MKDRKFIHFKPLFLLSNIFLIFIFSSCRTYSQAIPVAGYERINLIDKFLNEENFLVVTAIDSISIDLKSALSNAGLIDALTDNDNEFNNSHAGACL
jgi:hypothetical protein